jgi:AraC-like DNA-binding protein
MDARQRGRLNEAAAIRLRVGLLRAVYEGPALGVGRHASGLACLVEPLGGVVEVAWRGGLVVGKRVLIAAGVTHEVHTRSPRVRFTYLAPDEVPSGEVKIVATKPGLRRPDRRVLRVVHALARDPELRAPAVADVAGVSVRRLRALVRSELGASLAMLRWWLRMRVVAHARARGNDLTRAAHAAGFADSAHFSRTFRRMFGFAPSRLLARDFALTLDP